MCCMPFVFPPLPFHSAACVSVSAIGCANVAQAVRVHNADARRWSALQVDPIISDVLGTVFESAVMARTLSPGDGQLLVALAQRSRLSETTVAAIATAWNAAAKLCVDNSPANASANRIQLLRSVLSDPSALRRMLIRPQSERWSRDAIADALVSACANPALAGTVHPKKPVHVLTAVHP